MAQFLKNIRDELLKFPRDPKKYSILPIKKLEALGIPDTKSVMYKSIVLSETEKKENYANYIQFFKVSFSETKDKEHVIPVKVEGRLMYHEKPSIAKNPVFLRCSCPDFQHRWAFPLYDHKALIGVPTPYTKVSGSDRPSVNPKQLMGFCKHLYSMLVSLSTAEQITN